MRIHLTVDCSGGVRLCGLVLLAACTCVPSLAWAQEARAQAAADPRTKVSQEAASSFEFSDAPAFAIAGVTDWTAVGGHGSDATLRTSEDLAREATALRARNADVPGTKFREPSASAALEARLRAMQAAKPKDYGPNRELGLYYLRTGQYAQALTPLQTAMQLSGGNAEDTLHVAEAYRGNGKLAQARRVVADGLMAGGGDDLYRLAGELDEELGDPVKAAQEEERATHLNPSEANYFAWGSELLLHRAIWQAAAVFATGAKFHPLSARLRSAWGAALFAASQYGQAAQELCEASKLDPGLRDSYVLMGKAVIASPVPLPCVQERLESFVRAQPADAEGAYYLAMVLLKEGQAPKRTLAEALLRRSVTVDENFASGYLQLGILLFEKRDYPAALTLFAKAAKADPQMGEAHYRMAVIYDKLGDTAQAKREFDLHAAIDAATAARVEQQRREVKQFLITSSGLTSTAAQ